LRDVRELARGCFKGKMRRQAIRHYLQRWGIHAGGTGVTSLAEWLKGPPAPPPDPDRVRVVVEDEDWLPPDCLRTDDSTPKVIWRVFSRRGMEAFMFTSDRSEASIKAVREMLTKNRPRRWFMRASNAVLDGMVRRVPDR